MTLCCQVTNYPINALEREEIHPTHTGSNNFTGSLGSSWNIPMQAGNPFASWMLYSVGKYHPIFCRLIIRQNLIKLK